MNQGRAARACGGWSRQKLEGGAASTGSPEDASYRPAVAPAPRIVGPREQLGESSRGRLGTHSICRHQEAEPCLPALPQSQAPGSSRAAGLPACGTSGCPCLSLPICELG